MKRTRNPIASTLILLTFTCTLAHVSLLQARAQLNVPSVKIGGHEIKLGASIDSVVADLRTNYAVFSADKGTMREWWVSTSKNTMGIGVIYTKGNSIVGVEHQLNEIETNGKDDVFDALFAAATKLPNHHNSCIVTTWTDYVPNPSLNKAGVSLDCGAYRFRLQKNEFKGDDGRALIDYMVWESIGTTD